MKYALLFLLLSAMVAANAQTINDQVEPLLQDYATLDKADQVLDAYLFKNPNDADAYVLKGNVAYQRYVLGEPQIRLAGNENESIYDESIGVIGEETVILPQKTAEIVTGYFVKALKCDSARDDVYLGICYIYSISLQAEKLMAFLPTAKAHIEITENTPYDLAGYASNLLERDETEKGMAVYKKVAELFPESAGILSDIAGQYFWQGDLKQAKKYIDNAMTMKEADEMTYGNAFFIYAITGNYNAAQNAIDKQCAITKTPNNLVYKALVKMMNGQEWRADLQAVLKKNSDQQTMKDYINFLLGNDFTTTDNVYEKMHDQDVNDAFKLPVYIYLNNRLKSAASQYNYAEMLTYHHRYSDAIAIYEGIKTDNMNQEEEENLYLHFAWACYKSGNAAKANTQWEKLLKSDDFYYKSAAAYFLGKYYLGKKDRKKANEYFALVADKASLSKYAMYCSNLLKG